jgi:serine/threonine-protein kinase
LPDLAVKVIDFGMGAYVEASIESRLTQGTRGQLAGDHFTAPELMADPTIKDVRTDVYSVGAVWYAMLLNQPPAGADIVERLAEVTELSEGHRGIIGKCLRKDRYPTCFDLMKAIQTGQVSHPS